MQHLKAQVQTGVDIEAFNFMNVQDDPVVKPAKKEEKKAAKKAEDHSLKKNDKLNLMQALANGSIKLEQMKPEKLQEVAQLALNAGLVKAKDESVKQTKPVEKPKALAQVQNILEKKGVLPPKNKQAIMTETQVQTNTDKHPKDKQISLMANEASAEVEVKAMEKLI